LRFSFQKLPTLPFVAFCSLVITASTSATSFTLSETNLSGVTNVGTVTMTSVGSNVKVTIAMKPGYSIVTDDGHLMFNTTSGLEMTKNALGNFSVQGMSDKLQATSMIGGFTFSDIYKTDTDKGDQSAKGPGSGHKPGTDGDGDNDGTPKKHHHHHHPKKTDQMASNLTFTIWNANINQFTGFGVGFCITDQCGRMHGVAETAGIVSTVPEPGSFALFGTGLLGLAGLVLFRRSRQHRTAVA